MTDTPNGKPGEKGGEQTNLEVIALFLAFVVTVVSFWQGCETQRSNNLTQHAFEMDREDRYHDALDAADAAAKAAASARAETMERKRVAKETLAKMEASNALTLRGLRDSEHRFRLAQRAWIGLKEMTNSVVEVSKDASVHLEFTNTGLSPALDLRSCVTIGGSIPDTVYPNCNLRQGASFPKDVLVPNANHVVPARLHVPLTQKQFDALKETDPKKRTFLYVHGWVEYADAFLSPEKHVLTFCYYWEPENVGWMAYDAPHCGKTYDVPSTGGSQPSKP